MPSRLLLLGPASVCKYRLGGTFQQGLLQQEEERQRIQESDGVILEVSDVQQQSGVYVASLAAPADDRCPSPTPLWGCYRTPHTCPGCLGQFLAGLH